MVNPVPGVSVYLNADDITALDQAQDHLNRTLCQKYQP